MAGLARDRTADQGEGDQAQPVEHQEGAAEVMHPARHPGGDQRRAHGESKVLGMLHPAQRIVAEQDVAQ
ncbi:hypothetical protein G6F59_018526 [Rhizopus arrhizus]|uniref:Uncharacterized protein n=1 Tax=Rhizopus oryzae TaxID=64495 RepID=A0A9P6XLC6_RHIOR|nr:hypothetical protein G6F59_018526 [Rhizopus arrhizus]KAG1521540.1 hypothetical protein G6F51_014674 [Rhizopus arrhizus]